VLTRPALPPPGATRPQLLVLNPAYAPGAARFAVVVLRAVVGGEYLARLQAAAGRLADVRAPRPR
jgi:hypothetical protein